MPAYRFGDDRGAALPTPTDPAINATQPSQAPTASARRLTPASYSVPSPARPQNRARPLTSHAANPCPPDSNQPVGLRNHATLTRICASWRETRPAKLRPAKLPAAHTRRDPSQQKCWRRRRRRRRSGSRREGFVRRVGVFAAEVGRRASA